uniref:Putative ABCC protein n=1 Tax=Chrysomela populi TaxID=154003 RepID=A0A0U9HZ93_CHRPP
MNNGRIENIGTFDTLADVLLKSIKRQDSQEDVKKAEVKEMPTKKHERMLSIVSVASSIGKEFTEVEQNIQEEVEKGQLSFSMYIQYYRTGASICLLVCMLLLFLIAQVFSNGCDLWVAHWTNGETANAANNTKYTVNVSSAKSNEINNIENSYDFIESQKNYIYIYTIFIAGSIILTTARSLLFYQVCMNASKGLHNKMFSNVLKAPMRFFNTNPSGRILNRFSRDIGAVDEILPKATIDAITAFLVMLGILMMVFIVTPWMILPAVILGILFYFFRRVYLSSAQDIKRIEGVNRAPVFSHISATLYGMSTIRSSKAEEMVIHEFDSLQDQHTGSWFMFLACSGALGFYLDCISLAFLILVTFQFLIMETNSGMSGNIGLVVSSSMILIGMLQLGVRQTTEVSSNMTSVERVMQYTKVEKEEELNPEATEKPKNWPSAGKIAFKNTYLRYAPEDPPALKSLNIVIQPGEKIGIVGRTGAGKSTLISSLFRLAPIDGTIAIDDIDTSTVSLEHLRSNISIIPQEPILFSASIRYNLDPFNKVSDDVIWQALNDVELKDTIESLDQKVCEGGSNFSAGQRQLVCLARAIIRNNKILVMDEATANVDPHTDSLIQTTIRENFKDCTVLTIAHRLNTIMDCDKVLVMDSGKAVEFEAPHRLLQLPGGFFTKMVEKTGPAMEAQLRQIAKIAYKLED